MTSSPAAASRLRVFIFGCGQGESIVLECDGRFGVIDSFRHQNIVPALQLLKTMGAERLDFLGLTHPHEDHYGGLGEILEHFISRGGVGEFWRYPALDWSRLFPVLKARVYKKRSAPKFQALAGASLDELQGFYRRLFEARGAITIRNLELGFHWPSWDPVQFRVLAPSGTVTMEAAERLAREVTRADQKREPLNDYSFALHVQLNEHSVYLMGDTSNRSWNISRSDPLWPGLIRPKPSVIVRASHHGSDKDNPDWLLSAVRGTVATRIAVTRYTPSNLPRSGPLTRLAALGAAHRLSDYPAPTGPSFEPECLELEFNRTNVVWKRWSMAQLSGRVWKESQQVN